MHLMNFIYNEQNSLISPAKDAMQLVNLLLFKNIFFILLVRVEIKVKHNTN